MQEIKIKLKEKYRVRKSGWAIKGEFIGVCGSKGSGCKCPFEEVQSNA